MSPSSTFELWPRIGVILLNAKDMGSNVHLGQVVLASRAANNEFYRWVKNKYSLWYKKIIIILTSSNLLKMA